MIWKAARIGIGWVMTMVAGAMTAQAESFLDICRPDLNGNIRQECLNKNDNRLTTPGEIRTICSGFFEAPGYAESFNFIATFNVEQKIEVQIRDPDVGNVPNPRVPRKQWGIRKFFNFNGTPIARITAPLPVEYFEGAEPTAAVDLGFYQNCLDIRAYRVDVFNGQARGYLGIAQATTDLGVIKMESGLDDDFDDAVLYVEKVTLDPKDVDLRYHNGNVMVAHDVSDIFHFFVETTTDLSRDAASAAVYLLPIPQSPSLSSIDSGEVDHLTAYIYPPTGRDRWLSGGFSHKLPVTGSSAISLDGATPRLGCEIRDENTVRCPVGGTVSFRDIHIYRFSYDVEPFNFRRPCFPSPLCHFN